MENKKYLEITLNVPENHISRIMDKIMSVIHKNLALNNSNVGISFPLYTIKDENCSTGSIIRLFGDLQSLKKIWNENIISEMECNSDIEIEMLHVPKNYKKVKYLRDRTIDNYRNEKNVRKSVPETFPIIKMNSSSTKKFFLIHLKKCYVDIEENTLKFNSYGLSNTKENSWVPEF